MGTGDAACRWIQRTGAPKLTHVNKDTGSPVGNDPSGRHSSRSVRVMNMVRQVTVFDAADLHAESAFWAGVLGGQVFEDDDWHSVIDAAGQWRIGVQLAPDHVPPGWPHGTPQQVIWTFTSTTREPRTNR